MTTYWWFNIMEKASKLILQTEKKYLGIPLKMHAKCFGILVVSEKVDNLTSEMNELKNQIVFSDTSDFNRTYDLSHDEAHLMNEEADDANGRLDVLYELNNHGEIMVKNTRIIKWSPWPDPQSRI